MNNCVNKKARAAMTKAINAIPTCDNTPLNGASVPKCSQMEEAIAQAIAAIPPSGGGGGATLHDCNDLPLASGAQVVPCDVYTSNRLTVSTNIADLDGRVTNLEAVGVSPPPYRDHNNNVLAVGTKIVSWDKYTVDTTVTENRLTVLEARKAIVLKDCSNIPLIDGAQVVPCSDYTTNKALVNSNITALDTRVTTLEGHKDIVLKDCSNAPLIDGAQVVDCGTFTTTTDDLRDDLTAITGEVSNHEGRITTLEQASGPTVDLWAVADGALGNPPSAVAHSFIAGVSNTVAPANAVYPGVVAGVANRVDAGNVVYGRSNSLREGLDAVGNMLATSQTATFGAGNEISAVTNSLVMGTGNSITEGSYLTCIGQANIVTASDGVHLLGSDIYVDQSSNIVAIGDKIQVYGAAKGVIALGGNITVNGAGNSVVLGDGSTCTDEVAVVSVGSTLPGIKRRIINVAAAQLANDAVILGQLPIAKGYVHTPLTVGLNTAYTITHNMGVKPKIVVFTWRFTAAAAGYVIGDEIPVPGVVDSVSVATETWGIQRTTQTTTTLSFHIGASGILPSVIPKTGGTRTTVAVTTGQLIVSVYG